METNANIGVTPAAKASTQQRYKKYMIAFLLITYGIFYAIGAMYVFASEFMFKTFGELSLTHPIILFVLHSPSIAGMLMYLWYGGIDGLTRFLKTTIPEKKDLKWIPIILISMFLYLYIVRLICIAVGMDVPAMTQPFSENATIFLTNIVMEIGMLGSAWGWYGFFYPYIQRYLKNNIVSGSITGLALGLYLAPGVDFSEAGIFLTFFVYVFSFIIYSICISYILDDTKNNVLFFILSFWVMSSGSKLQFYHFVWQTQIVQISLFLVVWLALHIYFRVIDKPLNKEDRLNIFPDFIYK